MGAQTGIFPDGNEQKFDPPPTPGLDCAFDTPGRSVFFVLTPARRKESPLGLHDMCRFVQFIATLYDERVGALERR